MEFWIFDHTSSTNHTAQVEGDNILIGRDEQCQLNITGPFIARKHAKVYLKGNQLFIENLSRSSMRVANRDITIGTPARLDFGDEIQIGQYSIALTHAGRKQNASDQKREMQKRLVGFEKEVHHELIDRLNLRVTGHVNKNDENYRRQIFQHLNEIIQRRANQIDEALMNHMVSMHMHRLVMNEVHRQCTGKIQTEYRGAEVAIDPAMDKAIVEIVTSMVDFMPLVFDPTSVQEDLAVADESFDDVLNDHLPSISINLKAHMVRSVVAKDLLDIMFGLGPIQDLLEMANVTEIMVVGKDSIYVEKNGVIQATTRSFFSDEVLMSVIERILVPIGRRVDQSTPLVDARTQDGSRVNVIIPPLSLIGPCLTIRKFAWIPFTVDDLIERKSISEQCASFLQGCVAARKNIVVSGGTGSGKTTLLNTLCAFVGPSERIVTIEESAELRLPQPHVVGLEARPANVEGRGAYTIRELVRNSLRMRPDRVIVGEVRGSECLDMLQAMNTGHDGSLSTLHANNPHDAAKRMETMVMMAVEMPVRAIREQIVSAVDIVVQLRRLTNGQRRITHISEITEIDRETSEIRLEDIFHLENEDSPRMTHTGYVPTFCEEMIAKNLIKVESFL